MFGGEPIKGDAKIVFESVDFKKSRCIFIQQMKLNPDDTKRVMMQVLSSMGLKDHEMELAMQSAKFDINDTNRFEYLYYRACRFESKLIGKLLLI
ncbi:MAG: hypothetical protein IPP71_07655 [Bacteroidetes bacterium]|nr:hypothetical protein [Bacteroidota bacterium]